jgi:hypothetical protein
MKKVFLSLFVIANCVFTDAQEYLQTCLRLPDTGQSKSFTNTPGEDSDYQINTPFYVDNGDGTITDTVTGLMWQKADYGDVSFENATTYCDTLTLAGYQDWRLPTAHESFTIINLDVTNPAMNKLYFPISSAEYWWSSTKQYNDASKIWVTNAGGGIGNHLKTESISAGGTKKFFVRAVREPVAPTKLMSRFIDNNDGTVTDLATNLVWMKSPTTQTFTWEEALNYAENLSFASNSDWRLPSIKELESIRNDATSVPAVDQSKFQIPATVKKLWSSTSLIIKDNSKSWFWDTQYGITTYEMKTVPLNILCVSSYKPKSTLSLHEDNLSEIKVIFNQLLNEINILLPGNMKGKVAIYDLLGKLIFEDNLESKETSISTLKMKSGTYIINIQSEIGDKFSQKIQVD